MSKYEDSLIEEKFQKMGARARVTQLATPRKVARPWNGARGQVSHWAHLDPAIKVDVVQDRDGEYFSVFYRGDVNVRVIDLRPIDRHLLLEAAQRGQYSSRFLCGHDERAWFVAAIPESASAVTVQKAKDALKPTEVWEAIREHGVRPEDWDKRRTRAFVRQGEWFFIPRPGLVVDERLILRKEWIQRGSGKPHICQFLYRVGGEVVHVSDAHPNGLTDAEFQSLPREERRQQTWRTMQRDAKAYVRGAVWHRDHQTIWLNDWHEVVMNTETQSRAMEHVAFLD